MILPWPGVAHVEIRFHIGPLAEVEIQVRMGIGIAILAVNIADAPGRILDVVSGGLVKRYGVLSFFGYFIMKDKGKFLKKCEKEPE